MSSSQSTISKTETTSSLLTAPGRCALTVLSVIGPSAHTIVRQFFTPKSPKAFDRNETGRPYYGEWQSRDFDYLEDLIVWIRGNNSLEIHCHGGNLAWQQIVRDLKTRNVTYCPWEETLGKLEKDPVRREALRMLPDARTAKCAAVLLDQLDGALTERIRAIKKLIIAEEVSLAIRALDELAETSQFGARLTEPWKVVLCGSPNVGKSSLINCILGYQRSIVFNVAGTTRDVISDLTAIDGWPIRITDTVGVRSTESPLESKGIHTTALAAQNADLVVHVIDIQDLNQSNVSSPFANIDYRTDKQGSNNHENKDQGSNVQWQPNILEIVNKVDLATSEQLEAAEKMNLPTVSALSLEGLDHLLNSIIQRLLPCVPQQGAPIAFTLRQTKLILESLKNLRKDDADVSLAHLDRIITQAK